MAYLDNPYVRIWLAHTRKMDAQRAGHKISLKEADRQVRIAMSEEK